VPNLEQTEQALRKLEEVREMIRQAEVELRESTYYPPPEARGRLSEATSNLAAAEQALHLVLGILEDPP